MLGGTLTLAAGGQRRHGWGLVAMAAVAAALPDWDGLSILFGGEAYGAVHRLWGHNLLVAAVTGAICGAAGYWCRQSARVQRGARSLLERLEKRPVPAFAPLAFSGQAQSVWVLVGVLAALSHLPADFLYGSAAGVADWPVRLQWPFSPRAWAWPILAWGDLGPTAIFIVEMFALYRWPARARLVAGLTLLALAGYLAVRALLA